MRQELSRRVFLERLGLCAAGGAALSQVMSRPAKAQDPESPQGLNTVSWTPPAVLSNPNILLVMVDQFRWPCWLSDSQMATLDSTYLPNIFGRIRDNSYVFSQYYVAATMCTPSRAAMMTGLYAPQTAMYETGEGAPELNTAFQTWGEAIPYLNPAYQENVWWFGKWHLSDDEPPSGSPPPASPLASYGFKTQNYPGALGPSPNGWPNEGLNGGVNTNGKHNGTTYANDQMIAQDFIGWLEDNPNLSGSWCATVSFVNPHDIGFAPGWFGSSLPPSSCPNWPGAIFPSDFPNGLPPNPPPASPAGGPPVPYAPSPAALCTAPPQGKPPVPNWENLTNPNGAHYVSNKPSYQRDFLKSLNNSLGPVSNWTQFQNWYYWLQNFVDQQIGHVLDALNNSAYGGNTIVIFTSDHGEFAGSHGLHEKGGAVYDEAMHVPLYVQFPEQQGVTKMSQMCSSVDLFGLMCDLATSGSGAWRMNPNLQNRQSIWSFLYGNNPETRVVNLGPGGAPIPYVLHTVDETSMNEYCPSATGTDNRHIVCLRTPSAKLAVYSYWDANTACWDGVTPQEFEFYDYSTNRGEVGNDYTAGPSGSPTGPPNPNLQDTIEAYVTALGVLIPTELDATLPDALKPAQTAAQQAFFDFSTRCSMK